jgi:hypothetical protein
VWRYCNRFREAVELFSELCNRLRRGAGMEKYIMHALAGWRACFVVREVGQRSEIALGSFVSRPARRLNAFCEASKCQHPAVQTAQEIY